MPYTTDRRSSGQSLMEYALLIALVAVVAIASLFLLGSTVREGLGLVASGLQRETPEARPRFLEILDDFTQRIRDFYEANGRWPRSWGDYVYTDIGLNPDDWRGPVEGIYWGSNNGRVKLANRSGDEYQIYVNDLQGNQLHLYDGWSIWCPVYETACYYHNVAPGNEVDITSLTVVTE